MMRWDKEIEMFSVRADPYLVYPPHETSDNLLGDACGLQCMPDSVSSVSA
jgi:hypothetical protein